MVLGIDPVPETVVPVRDQGQQINAASQELDSMERQEIRTDHPDLTRLRDPEKSNGDTVELHGEDTT
jgi:hypothetical protein